MSEFLDTVQAEGGRHLKLQGDWTIENSETILPELRKTDLSGLAAIDASAMDRMDTWGALRLKQLLQDTGLPYRLNDRQTKVFDFLPAEIKGKPDGPKGGLDEFFVNLGKGTLSGLNTVYGMMAFIGEIAVVFARNIVRPSGFRFHSIIRHIEETGLRALPIIGLLAILISMVISYQAATQLAKFGASIFTVDLTVISLLREMGVLVTAIMVAGRSGSAFAAEIGVMKLREEIDALRTMGMNPVEVLVLPRLLAMMITLPILTFLADVIGLAGGGIISMVLLDIPLEQYIARVEQVAKPTMFFVGLIKAPVFAFIITIIGTYQGMNVSGSAESVGKLTTLSVVQAIFVVILVDALFSIIFANLGI